MNRQGSPFKSLMQGLYYPAILGTGIVLLLVRFTMHTSIGATLSDLAIYFGFLFTLFFSASFLINQDVPDNEYRATAFILDLGEIVLVFLGYYVLGLYNTSK